MNPPPEHPEGTAGTNPAVNRRAHPRRPCNYEATCRSGGRAWSPVRFVDLSVGGAGVMLLSPIEVGATVMFTVATARHRLLQIQATVRRLEERNGEWLAGCAFTELLSDEDFADLA